MPNYCLQGEPITMTDKKIEFPLDRENSEFRHWLEISKIGSGMFRVEKKDSKPVFNESKYDYSLNDGELSFEGGSKSCSGAGRYRSDSPGAELDETIKSLIRERFIKVDA